MKIPFCPPYIDQDIINEVTDTLYSGWITSGPKVKALEEEIVRYTKAEAALCVNSWSSGAQLILKWWGIGPGDEVIVPAYTYSATALAVLHVGAVPVMVDAGADFNLTLQSIRKAITAKTKAIIPVDIAGWPCDYDGIMEIVQEAAIRNTFSARNKLQEQLGRILIISDAAHSVGARYKGRPTGTLADVTIFSFHAVKNITTAEGGAVCLSLPMPFDNAAIYKYLKVFGLNGQTKDAFAKSQGGGWRYDIIAQGLKVNMPDVCAAIGLAQIRKYDHQLLQERQRVFYAYTRLFADFEWAQLPMGTADDTVSSFHLYTLRIKGIDEQRRDRMIDLITAQEVSVNVHFIPMPMFTLFKELGYKIADYPVAYDNYAREISLPIYPQLSEEQIEFIVKSVTEAYTLSAKDA